MSKLKLNFEGKQVFPRHYWNFQQKVCSCGCARRLWLWGNWHCINSLQEELNKEGFSLEKNFDTRDKEF